MNTYNPDAPFEEVTRAAKKLSNEGHLVFQKWTCSACGDRVITATPNIFYKVGRHEDCTVNPDVETDLVRQGCNYMVIQANTEKGQRLLAKLTDDDK